MKGFEMTIIDQNPDAQAARRLRQKLAIDQIDYRRSLQRLAESKLPQRDLSEYLRISQPTLSSTLRSAKKTPPVREGFSGADPYEIAQRYAVGEISREQLVDELSRWDYEPGPEPTDGYDTLIISVPGSFDDVVRAFSDGLIDAQLYDEILDAASGAAS